MSVLCVGHSASIAIIIILNIFNIIIIIMNGIIITGLVAAGTRSDGNVVSYCAAYDNIQAIYACFSCSLGTICFGICICISIRHINCIIQHRLLAAAVTIRYHNLLLLILTSFGFHIVGHINPMAAIIAHALNERLQFVRELGKGLKEYIENINLCLDWVLQLEYLPHRWADKSNQ